MREALTAVVALAVCAVLAGAVYLNLSKGRGGAAPRRKSGAVTPSPTPDDTPDTAAPDDLGLLRRLLALEARFEQIEGRLVDLKESTDRRFGRLHAAKSRDALPPTDGEDDDPAQLGIEFTPRRVNGGAPPTEPRRRFLVPRR